jgi:glycosyltransferase involved in cell wall biosynthesis
MRVDRPRLSLIVEWDNARYYEIRRAGVTLRRVLAQLDELGEPAEILLVFDARAIDEVRVKEVAADLVEDARGGVEVSIVATDGLRYYQLKNEGARRSRGDILLFVDSDVIPDDGWLRKLVASFRDPAVQVVMANPYVEAETLYGKAFALAWYFPSRTPEDRPVPTTHSFANSIAFRRETFQRHPFPDDRALYIGQCRDFTAMLRRIGIEVYMNPAARVRHPPPRFLRSAVINGHDAVIRQRRAGDARARASCWRLRGHLVTAARRVGAERRTVGLSRAGACAALVIATSYYVVSFAAELLTWINPRVIHRLYAL